MHAPLSGKNCEGFGLHASALSRVTHRRNFCINKFMRLDASRSANFVDRIPRATIKIIESLQGEGPVLNCDGIDALLELFAQEVKLVRLSSLGEQQEKSGTKDSKIHKRFPYSVSVHPTASGGDTSLPHCDNGVIL